MSGAPRTGTTAARAATAGVAVVALALALAPAAARAESSVEANGWASLRGEYTAPRPDVPLGALAAPEVRFLLELNAQLRVRYSERFDLYADLSFYHSNFVGEETPFYAALRGNTFLVNELYQNLGLHEHLTALVGKKRIVWGTGFVWNPTDILNAGKDPTDPALQRVGAWLALVEVPFAKWTLSALFAPRVLATEAGFPTRLLVDADDPAVEGARHAHWIAGARAYALLFDTDATLMYYLTDRYGDEMRHRSHAGVALARTFFDYWEVHFEGLAHLGSTRSVVNPECLGDEGVKGDELPALLGCALQDPPAFFLQPDLEQDRLFVRLLGGLRYTFADSSLLNVEYYYNGEGLRRDEWRDRRTLMEFAGPLLADAPAGLPFDPAAVLFGGSGASDAEAEGTPARLRFDPARRHYLFASYIRPQIRDDFTWTLTLIAGLEDASFIAATSLTWAAREWMQLIGYASVPFGPKGSEFGDLPQWGRVSLEVKLFY